MDNKRLVMLLYTTVNVLQNPSHGDCKMTRQLNFFSTDVAYCHVLLTSRESAFCFKHLYPCFMGTSSGAYELNYEDYGLWLFLLYIHITPPKQIKGR